MDLIAWDAWEAVLSYRTPCTVVEWGRSSSKGRMLNAGLVELSFLLLATSCGVPRVPAGRVLAASWHSAQLVFPTWEGGVLMLLVAQQCPAAAEPL